MQAETPNINNVFNRSRKLQIPHFQRSYVWKEEQWERFLEDMKTVSQLEKPYFLGSIILKHIETPIVGGVGGIHSIIDGQQRLTTVSILLVALLNFLKNKSEKDEMETILTEQIPDFLINKHSLDKDKKIRLKPNKSDRENFEKYVTTACSKRQANRERKGSFVPGRNIKS